MTNDAEIFGEAIDMAAKLEHKVLAWALTTTLALLQSKDPTLYNEITKLIGDTIAEAERKRYES